MAQKTHNLKEGGSEGSYGDRPRNRSDGGYESDGLQSPELSNSLKAKNRAIKDEKQLKSLIVRFEQENTERNTKNARIMAKYNSERPYRQSDLESEGLAWKSNFSSQPLATLIDRIAPRFARALNSARYLTSAKLPDMVPASALKTERYRAELTKLCRSRKDWKNFVAEVAQENALFGYTCAAFVDEFSWWPRHFRQDEFFVPEGTKQSSGYCQIVILRETLLIHELFKLIEDKEEASDAGWDVEKVVEAINDAMPDDLRSGYSGDARKYADMARESTLYASHATGAKSVILSHAFVTEHDGKVSHYILDSRNWKQLFSREDRFDNMAQVATFFSFQQATGKLKASKGVGRTVYALAGIIDRARNEVVDRLQLSGKVLVTGDPRNLAQLKMSVIGNCVFIGKDFEVQKQKIDAGVESFLTLDTWVKSLMDEIAGNVSPAAAASQLQGERVTNGQVNFIADLQNEGKDVKIERFVTQFADLFSEIGRRASAEDVDDEAAKLFQSRCLEIMSREELDYLATQPAAETIEDLTDVDRQTIIAVATEHLNDPMCDRRKLLEKKLSAAVDSEFAEDVLLADQDPKVTAEQTVQQMLENLLLQAGTAVPVSPRQNHVIHMDGALALADQLSTAIAEDPTLVEKMALVADHIESHLVSASEQGVDKNLIGPYVEKLKMIRQGIQHIAQAAQSVMQPPAA
jgi:hypothetical protein